MAYTCANCIHQVLTKMREDFDLIEVKRIDYNAPCSECGMRATHIFRGHDFT